MSGIVLAGYYGFGNFGDELLLKAFIQRFRSSSSVDRIYVLTPKRSTHSSFQSVKRTDFLDIGHALLNSRSLIFGGGSIFQDSTSSLSLYYYLSLILLAYVLRRKVILAFQGIGPIRNRFNVVVFAFIIRHCTDYVSVRDNDSLLILRKLGLNMPVYQYMDPAFGAIPLPPEQNEESGVRKVLGVNVRLNPNHTDERDFRTFTAVLGDIARQHDLLIRFFVVQDSEEELVEYIRSHIGYPHVDVVRVTVENYRKTVRCDWMLSMRLHLLMLAYSWSIPILGLAYDIKVRSFLRSVDCPYVGVRFKGLQAKLDYLVTGTTPPQTAATREETRKEFTRSIEKGFEDVEAVISGNKPVSLI